MKRLFTILLLLLTSVCYAQNLSISIDGEVYEDSTDLDARAYFPKYDINDKLCALIKVTLTNKLSSPLILEVGGLGVVAREEKESGEIWFYVPAQVRNLIFKCATYKTPPAIAVKFDEGCVYRITLCPDAVVQTVTNAVLSTNYLKFRINVPSTTISLGRSQNYELLTEHIDDVDFVEYLDYGLYYYKIEHPLYETYTGSIELGASTQKQEIELTPAFGFLDINTSPEGAEIYLNGEKIGITPYQLERPIPKGEVELRFQLDNYHTSTTRVGIIGDGGRQIVSERLRPRFAEVTLVCPDEKAEIWIDNQFKGVGTWSGRLLSTSRHLVETKRTSHLSQSTQLSLNDGDSITHSINAPIPLYGTINVNTTPHTATIEIDGTAVGETPFIGQILIGQHEIVISKEGFVSESLSVDIEHNKHINIDRQLISESTLTKVSISCVDKSAEIYINDKKVGTGEWSGLLAQKTYLIECRKQGHATSSKEITIENLEALAIPMSAPKKFYNTTDDGKESTFGGVGGEITWDGAYIGANVGSLIYKRFGVHASFAMGFENIGEEFAIGPLVGLGSIAGIETQAYAGVGYNTYEKATKYEAGVRLAYNVIKTLRGSTTITLGATYINGCLYPKFGLGYYWE